MNQNVVADEGIAADHGARANRDARGESRGRIDNRRRMNERLELSFRMKDSQRAREGEEWIFEAQDRDLFFSLDVFAEIDRRCVRAVDSRRVTRVREKSNVTFACFVQSRGADDLHVVARSEE